MNNIKEDYVKTSSFRLFVVTFCVVGAGAAPGFAQQLKIGYVNSAKILQEYPEAVEAQKRLDAFGKKIQDSLETMSGQYQSKLQEYQQKQTMLNDQTKQTLQQELITMEQRALDFRERKLGREGEYAKYQDKLLTPIYDKVKKVIEAVAKEEKVSFVFDKTDAVQILLYGDTKFDFTFKVIDKLKRK